MMETDISEREIEHASEPSNKQNIKTPLNTRGAKRWVMSGLLAASTLLTACSAGSVTDAQVTNSATKSSTAVSSIDYPLPNPAIEPVIVSGLSGVSEHQILGVEAYQEAFPFNPDHRPNIPVRCNLEPFSRIAPLENLSNNQFSVVYISPRQDTQIIADSTIHFCPDAVSFDVKVTDIQHPSSKIRGVMVSIPRLRQHQTMSALTSETVANALVPEEPINSIKNGAYFVSVLNDSISNGRRTFQRNDRGYVTGSQEDNSACTISINGTVRELPFIPAYEIDKSVNVPYYRMRLIYTAPVNNPTNFLNFDCPSGTYFEATTDLRDPRVSLGYKTPQ